ncbi:MAG: hypothetical protein M9895_12900 [Aquamicrobium sp.]|uniref:hypothetical protein n=1 Tax=Aquamicrobium sp. TaxID=1872579 RepID=UPI00349EBE53|nr:hypothetical protein [Aquamicrobium sp.]
MADFVAVLRKTIGGLGDTSPEMREKVFDKARATIEAKLKAIEPPPPAALIEKQKQALEEAIATVRAEFAEPAVPDIEDDLETVLADFDKPVVATPVVVTPPPAAAAPVSAPQASAMPRAQPAADAPGHDAGQPAGKPDAPSVSIDAGAARPARPRADDPAIDMLHAPAGERLAGNAAAPRRAAPVEESKKGRAGLIAALGLAALALAGGGYVWWSGLLGGPATTVAEAPETPGTGTEPAATTAEDLTQTPPEAEVEETPPPAQEAAAPEPAAEPDQPAAGVPEKFTQRLLADGSEVDEGPAGGQPGIGEGSSVATAVQPGQPPLAAQPDAGPIAAGSGVTGPGVTGPDATGPVQGEPAPGETPPAATAAQEPEQPAQPEATQPAAVAVGQRAIFYEERTSAAEGSAEVGSIAWSLVQESPGGDLPPEPAIRAEATIPAKDVQLRMTIRRNGDATLPASHIVEMIFLTPDGFEGGSISNVSRIAFKDTEQAPGNPLIGIPAKIADGFFLIALSDAPAEERVNLELLQRQSWLDIPIVYQSGRRALLSMEKGIPGERVFQDALKAWNELGSG